MTANEFDDTCADVIGGYVPPIDFNKGKAVNLGRDFSQLLGFEVTAKLIDDTVVLVEVEHDGMSYSTHIDFGVKPKTKTRKKSKG